MTALSTTSPGIKPPTTILDDTRCKHDGNITSVANLCGGKNLLCTGGGTLVRELDVTGSGYLQCLFCGPQSGTASVNLILTLDGNEIYNVTRTSLSNNGLAAAGGAWLATSGNEAGVSYDFYRFETGFTVDINTTLTNCYLVYKYYLDS